MNSWMIEIIGIKHELEQIINKFLSPDLNIKENNNLYYLCSNEFDSCVKPREVLKIGNNILKLINGISKLEHKNWQKFKLGNVICENENGEKAHFLICDTGKFIITGNNATLTVKRADGTIETDIIAVPSSLNSSIIPAHKNSNVQKALGIYLDRELNWVNLYNILEVVESDVGSKKVLVSNGWISDHEIRSFKHTANSISAVGDEARHGKELSTPPTNPMSLTEATTLVETVLKKWIDSK